MAVNSKPANELPLIIDYLERNPNLFLDHPELLPKLNLPHINGNNISSLIEYQVDCLRRNDRLLNTKICELSSEQEQFDYLSKQVHEQALALMEVETIEALYDRLFLFLKREYQCSHLLIFIFVEKRPRPDHRDLRFKPIHSKLRYLFSGLFNVNKPLCDSLPTEYIDALFAKQANKIKSTVSLPIKINETLGLFILGSQEYNVYKQGFSIKQLDFLKSVFVKKLNQLL